jgi:DNA-binding CsgD family transcriptional regulator
MVSGDSKESKAFHKPEGFVDGLSCVELFSKRQNKAIQTLEHKIRAWGDLLDLLGWCVVFDLNDGAGKRIGKTAQAWLSQQNDSPWQVEVDDPEWLDHMRKQIPAEQLKVSVPGLLVWNTMPAQEATCGIDAEVMLTLTRREREIMQWLREGKTCGEIAIIVGISIRTVEKHLENIYRKLGVRDRTSLIMPPDSPASN